MIINTRKKKHLTKYKKQADSADYYQRIFDAIVLKKPLKSLKKL